MRCSGEPLSPSSISMRAAPFVTTTFTPPFAWPYLRSASARNTRTSASHARTRAAASLRPWLTRTVRYDVAKAALGNPEGR